MKPKPNERLEAGLEAGPRHARVPKQKFVLIEILEIVIYLLLYRVLK